MRILATARPCGSSSRVSIQLTAPCPRSRRGLMTTSSSSTGSTSWSRLVPSARAIGTSWSIEMRRCPVSMRLSVEALMWHRPASASSDQPRATRRPLPQTASTVKSMSDTHAHDHHPHGHGAHSRAHQHQGAADDDYTDLLDLDAEVLHGYWSAALDWVRDAAADAPRARLLDLGAGTGVGAIGLARRYPDAEVVALDVSPVSVARVRAKAADLGLAQRVRAVEADLDLGWPDLGWPSLPAPNAPRLDLTWASMSLHHMADPGQVLRDALADHPPGRADRGGGVLRAAALPPR